MYIIVLCTNRVHCKLFCEILIQLHQARSCYSLDNAESSSVLQVYFNNYFNDVYSLNNRIIILHVSVHRAINNKNVEADLNFSKYLKEF